jgi:RecA/RadA recombinase
MAVDVVVVDSVAALVPRAELEGEIGQVQVGVTPLEFSDEFVRIVTC